MIEFLMTYYLNPAPTTDSASLGSWQWALGLLPPYRKALLFTLLVMISGSCLSLLVPWIGGRFAELLVLQPSDSFFILLLLLAVTVSRGLAAYHASVLLGSATEAILMDMRYQTYHRIQRLYLKEFRLHSRGDYLNLFTDDLLSVSSFTVNSIISILPRLVILTGALYFIFRINSSVLLLILLALPFYVLGVKWLSRRVEPVSADLFELYARTLDRINENLELLPQIKSAVREDEELRQYHHLNTQVHSTHRQLLKTNLLVGQVVQTLFTCGTALLLWYAASTTAEVTISELVSLVLYGMVIAQPATALAGMYGEFRSANAALTRVRSIAAKAPEPYGIGDDSMMNSGPRIEFRDVDFAFEPGRPILKQFSLVIEPGETVVLAGPNGIGKSTIIDLLCRFKTPQQGQILINGIDIQDIEITHLRRQIGLIPQNALLFNRTIEENLQYGGGSGSANFEFLGFLKKGQHQLNDLAGERGQNLSGGERQRILLAQLLSSDKPLLIMDEATAMLDREGEEAVWEESQRYLENRTVIIVSHSPDVVAPADRIITLPLSG